jgi:ClpP class serine protease
VHEVFPRTSALPLQSPIFWVQHKDRYLRQLLIRDIEAKTGRSLIVYYSDCDSQESGIDGRDDVYIAELLNGAGTGPVDLLLETNGGATDATEKICSLLRSNNRDLRVIVPRRAKSNGTVVALTGTHILMGMESELGPIDPHIGPVPVEFILGAPGGTMNVIDLQSALTFRMQTQKLAKSLLQTGMLKESDPDVVETLVQKLATRLHYHSHGSVIDSREASDLGLAVINHNPDDELWRLVCLLRAMYQFDCQQQGFVKVFEAAKISLVVAQTPIQPKPS